MVHNAMLYDALAHTLFFPPPPYSSCMEVISAIDGVIDAAAGKFLSRWNWRWRNLNLGLLVLVQMGYLILWGNGGQSWK